MRRQDRRPLQPDRGLVEAVRERAARLPIPTEVSCDGLAPHARFAPDIEGAAYFFVCEALGTFSSTPSPATRGSASGRPRMAYWCRYATTVADSTSSR